MNTVPDGSTWAIGSASQRRGRQPTAASAGAGRAAQGTLASGQWGAGGGDRGSWVMFVAGPIAGFPSVGSCLGGSSPQPGLQVREGDRQVSSQAALGVPRSPPRGAASWVASTHAAPCWGSKQIPSSWALEGVSGSPAPLFHASDSGDMAPGPEVLRPAGPVQEAGWTQGEDQGP